MKRVFWILVDCFAANNLLTYASAIAFQLLVALIPMAALALVLLGYLDLQDVWHERIGPSVEDKMPPATFIALDATVRRLLVEPHPLWLVLAAAISLWEVSGSVRAVMGATNRIYGGEEDRHIVFRFVLSFALAAVVILCVFGAAWSATFTSQIPAVPAPLELVARWLFALLLIWAMLAVLLRLAPVRSRPARWISAGSVLVVLTWFAASLAYGLYVQHVVTLQSAFGFVALGLVTTGYLYTSAIIFLVGVQIDELVRRRKLPF